MAQFISVEEAIQNLLIEEGKSSEHEYLRYFNLAMSGLKELNFDTVRQIKSIELEIDHKNTVSLPTDYVSYLRIATTNSNGELNYLGARDRINLVMEPHLVMKRIKLNIQFLLTIPLEMVYGVDTDKEEEIMLTVTTGKILMKKRLSFLTFQER